MGSIRSLLQNARFRSTVFLAGAQETDLTLSWNLRQRELMGQVSPFGTTRETSMALRGMLLQYYLPIIPVRPGPGGMVKSHLHTLECFFTPL